MINGLLRRVAPRNDGQIGCEMELRIASSSCVVLAMTDIT